ncbi:DUF1440 domain-containing protein [Methylobacterium sp. R2-1]|uniref:DUF1440 domain-containing protein n=1 Tax=Methylobacterium sp. R2-1 TaxID=2587064 RepID=UPI003917BEFF
MAHRAAHAVEIEPPSPPQENAAGLAVHYSLGIVPGAIYGALRGRVPYVDAGAGLVYGLGMFILEDEIANPLLGTTAPPQRYPWQAHARGLVAHLVYGVFTELVLRALATRPKRYGTPWALYGSVLTTHLSPQTGRRHSSTNMRRRTGAFP